MADEIGSENWEKINPEYIIKSGYADEDILAYAHENNSQLIVIGSTGNSPNSETIGSITVDIMYNARVPVLVVPEDTPDQELENFSKVLYATNFDEKDFVALDKLMSILYPFDIKVVRYALPLALAGLFTALYHNLLYSGIIPESIQPCSQGVSCTEKYIDFGFITIPLLSALSFSTIILLLIILKILNRRTIK